MALSDTWLKEFEEAAKLADDITGRLREREIIQSTGGDPSHLIVSTRRKITVLGTCLDRLESLLQNPPEKPILSKEEIHRRQDMLLGIRLRTKQMAASFSTSPSNRAALSGLAETTMKKRAESVRVDLTETVPPKQAMTTRHRVGDAAETAPPNQAMTTKHRAVDVIDESSLQERLLNRGIDASDSQSKGDDDDKGSSGSCNMQLSCLIILGVLVLVLLVWTIIKIW
ncbi:hypothetical protein KP509_14G030000 [Ceratopteris richardii]|uniref:Uncharacterized protein n=1 Tax=Ceratopteris richardii TaxID=49495 RepID=A0A8T2T6N9_CERRI|nr:hypothetical protein KP509_14G030000 [Ceratopteris richardii]